MGGYTECLTRMPQNCKTNCLNGEFGQEKMTHLKMKWGKERSPHTLRLSKAVPSIVVLGETSSPRERHRAGYMYINSQGWTKVRLMLLTNNWDQYHWGEGIKESIPVGKTRR